MDTAPRPRRPQSDDHDLLIRIDTKLENLTQRVEQMVTQNETRFATKADQAQLTGLSVRVDEQRIDTEKRLRFIERVVYGGLGVLAVVEIALAMYLAWGR